MDKKEVLEVYRRYLTSLNDQNANIGENLDAWEEWLEDNTDYSNEEEEALRGRLRCDSIYQALRAIERWHISCKQRAGATWNKDAVQHGYLLLNNLNKALDEGEDSRAKVITISFWEHVLKFRNDAPWLYLYMHIAYSRTFAGSWLNRHRIMMDKHNELMKFLEQCDQPDPSG